MIGKVIINAKRCHGDGHLTWDILEGFQTTLIIQGSYSSTFSILRRNHHTLIT